MLQISKTGDLPTPESSLRRWSSGRDWPGLSQLGGIYQGLCGRGGWKMGCWKSGCVSNWIDLGSLNVFRMIRGRIRSKGARVETCWWKMSYAKKLKDMLLHASLAGHGMGQKWFVSDCRNLTVVTLSPGKFSALIKTNRQKWIWSDVHNPKLVASN